MFPFTERDLQIRELYMDLICGFARDGKPSTTIAQEQWKPIGFSVVCRFEMSCFND